MDYINVPLEQEINANGLIYDLGSLYDYLSRLVDPRDARGKRYLLVELLVLMLLAKLAGQQNASEIAEWVAHRIEILVEMKLLCRAQAPSHMTYRRVNQEIVNVEQLERLAGNINAVICAVERSWC